MSPKQLVKCIDFTYITDAITQEEALAILQKNESTKQQRIDLLLKNGYPAYTTSAGWLGYSDEKMRRLCKEAKEEGFKHMKIKVGSDIKDDIRRAAIIREEIGEEFAENIAAYINDSKHFIDKMDYVRSFEAIVWAWAWIEIGKDIGVISIKDINEKV